MSDDMEEAREAAREVVAAEREYEEAGKLRKEYAFEVYKEKAIICGGIMARALLSSVPAAPDGRDAVIEECAEECRIVRRKFARQLARATTNAAEERAHYSDFGAADALEAILALKSSPPASLKEE